MITKHVPRNRVRAVRGDTLNTATAHLALLVAAVIVLAPIAWLVLSSLKTIDEVFTFSWFPKVPQWKNYIDGLTTLDFTRYFVNSIFITTVNVIGGTLVSAMAAFSFARLSFPGRNLVFGVVISTMMLPLAALMVPSFVLFRYLGWIDTYTVMTVPVILAAPGFFIFLMRQYFMSIPRELDDAAKIDGCGFFRIFWSVLMPLSKPAITTIAIYGFMGNWGNLLRPAIFLNSESMRTVTIGLALLNIQTEEPTLKLHLMLSNSVLFILPPVILYMFFQKYFTRLGGGLSSLTQR